MGSVCRWLERESRGGKARVGLGKVTRLPQARGSGLADLPSFLKPEASSFLQASFGPFCLLPSFVTGGSGFY